MGPNTRGHGPKLRALTPDEQTAANENRARQAEEHYQWMLKHYPPGVSFFAYSVPKLSHWPERLTELPTTEFLDQVGAEIWSVKLMAGSVSQHKNFVVKAMHHGSRVIEFEYVYQDKKLLDYWG